jgi:hypothetical protein
MILSWLKKSRSASIEPEAVAHENSVGMDAIASPFRGFTVLGIAYPNHVQPEAAPLTAYDISLRLSHDMDVDWFAHDRELRHHACTGPMRGNDENEVAFGFDFGPYDQDASDFRIRYTVVVRETAGGGFMVLLQDNGIAFADKIRALFEAVIADRDRENPEVDDDTDAAGQ